MIKAWRTIEHLIEKKAVHRSGFEIAEVRPLFIIGRMQGEMKELMNAPDDMSELADLLGVIFHYAIKIGWKYEDIERQLLDKLDLRFTIP